MNEYIDRPRKTITRTGLFYVRKAIKKESYQWYKTLREGEYEYIHEFKERINEIHLMQRSTMRSWTTRTYQLLSKPLSLNSIDYRLPSANLYDVAPTIIGVGANATISITPETKTTQQIETSSSNLSVLKGLPFWIWDKEQHTEQHIRTNGNCCFNHVVSLPIKNNINILCMIMKNYYMKF